MLNYIKALGTKAPKGAKQAVVEQPKTFVAEVIFGSPKKDCAGSGICKVINLQSREQRLTDCSKCSQAKALVQIEDSEHIIFRFIIRSMCSLSAQRNFGSGVFVVESPFVFQENEFPEAESKVIMPGIYPVKKDPHFLTVVFDMKSWE